MCSPVVIVLDIGSKHTAQMPFVEHDDVIEGLSPNAAHDSLHIRILPGTARCNLRLFDAHMAHSLLKLGVVDRVPIPQQIARRCIPCKRLDDLLGRPLCRGVVSDIEVHKRTTLVSEHDEHKEHPKCDSWHSEKVAGHDISAGWSLGRLTLC